MAYRTTRRHFTDAELDAIVPGIPSHNRSVTVMWDHDADGNPLHTGTIRAHITEYSAVRRAIRVATWNNAIRRES